MPVLHQRAACNVRDRERWSEPRTPPHRGLIRATSPWTWRVYRSQSSVIPSSDDDDSPSLSHRYRLTAFRRQIACRRASHCARRAFSHPSFSPDATRDVATMSFAITRLRDHETSRSRDFVRRARASSGRRSGFERSNHLGYARGIGDVSTPGVCPGIRFARGPQRQVHDLPVVDLRALGAGPDQKEAGGPAKQARRSANGREYTLHLHTCQCRC
jgi:hypothetical protein